MPLPRPTPRCAFQIRARGDGLHITGGLSEALLLGGSVGDALGLPVVGWDSQPRGAGAVCLSETFGHAAALAAHAEAPPRALLTPGLPPALWLAARE